MNRTPPMSASVNEPMDERSNRRSGSLTEQMAFNGRAFYEDQGARIPIVARSRSLHQKAGYIEADRFRPSKRKRLPTGGGPYICSGVDTLTNDRLVFVDRKLMSWPF